MLDYTGKSANKLKEKTLYLLDMDGTIYNENEIFDGTLEFLEEIERRGGQYVFITNNSSKSVEDYVQKVRAMGIKAEYENFYTSGQATAYVSKRKLSQSGGLLHGNEVFNKGASGSRNRGRLQRWMSVQAWYF